jgi:septal ring factor EnvC (AmiA/AmiB activator)
MPETVNQDVTVDEEQQTFTQADVNRIVNDRLKREREKYADYAEAKEKAAKYDAAEEESKSAIQKATEKADRLQAELDAIKKADEVRSIRAKVAKETGVPEGLLTGETEEACTEQAEAIKAYAKPSYPVIPDSGEVSNVSALKPEDKFREWFDATYK